MQVESIGAVLSVAEGGSSIPGKVAGLGRAAMFAGFIAMMDDWIALMKQGAEQAKAAADAKAATGTGDAMAEAMVAAMLPSSPFQTYKKGANGKFSVQPAGGLDPAMAMIQTIA